MLTVGDKKGKQAGAVRAAGGLPASIELVADPDAVGAKPLTHARLVVSGMAALAPVTVQVALTALGLELEPWAGGDRAVSALYVQKVDVCRALPSVHAHFF